MVAGAAKNGIIMLHSLDSNRTVCDVELYLVVTTRDTEEIGVGAASTPRAGRAEAYILAHCGYVEVVLGLYSGLKLI